MGAIKQFRRLYTIPDIHGRYDLLLEAYNLLIADGYSEQEDLLVFLGDMIDRGPESRQVLEYVKSLRERLPENVVVLRGNHEDFAVDTLVKHRPHAIDAWMWNGGVATQKSYPDGRMSEEHAKFLASLPYSYEAQGFYFSHAPVPRDKEPGQEYTAWERSWSYVDVVDERPSGLMAQHEGPRSENGLGEEHLTGLCGHVHRGPFKKEIRVFPKYRMLDCGAGCFPHSPLAIHECISGRTLYAYPKDISHEIEKSS